MTETREAHEDASEEGVAAELQRNPPEQPVAIRIGPSDVAVVNLPPGTTIRAVRESGEREYRDTFGEAPVVASLYGEAFGGAAICSGGLRGIRNGHHRRDRALWHEAARQVRGGGVVYVEHERQDWYGRQVWVAVRLRAREGVRP
jgi:hypothetical protein